MPRIPPTALLLALALAASACGSPRISTNGFVFSGLDLAFLEEGGTACSEVLGNLGTPTLARNFTGGPFGADTWFYMGQKTSFYAYHKPEVIEAQVLAVRFAGAFGEGETACGADPRVADVQQLTLADGRVFSFREDFTPTAGNERSLLQQFLGDIGRFSRPGF